MMSKKIVIRRVPTYLSLDVLILYIEDKLGEGTVDDTDPETKLSPDKTSASICLKDKATAQLALKHSFCIQRRPLLVEKWSADWAEKRRQIIMTSTGGATYSADARIPISTEKVPFLDFKDDPPDFEPEPSHLPHGGARPRTARNDKECRVPIPGEMLDFIFKLANEDGTMKQNCKLDKDKDTSNIIIQGSERAIKIGKDKVLEIQSKVSTIVKAEFTKNGVDLILHIKHSGSLSNAYHNRGIQASLTSKDGKLMLIAKDATSLNEADKLFEETFCSKKFPIPDDYRGMIGGDRWQAHLESLCTVNDVAISPVPNEEVLFLEGTQDGVKKSLSSLDDWLKNNTINGAKLSLSYPIWRLLKERGKDFWEKKDGLRKQDLTESGGKHLVEIEGTKEALNYFAEQLKNNGAKVVHSETLEVAETGMDMRLFIEDPGKAKLQKIEMDHQCIIEVQKGRDIMDKDTGEMMKDDDELKHCIQTKPKKRKEKLPALLRPKNLYIEEGNLSQSKVGTLVCSIPERSRSLEKAGILGKIFSKAAGDDLVAAFKKLNDDHKGRIPFGKAHITDAKGNLGCSYVIFIMLRHWNGKNIRHIESVIKSLIRECLEATKSAGQHSIAFPTLGAGKLNFPQQNVARCFCEAVGIWTRSNPGYAMQARIVAHENRLKSKYESTWNNEDESEEEEECEEFVPKKATTADFRGPKQSVLIDIFALGKNRLESAKKDVEIIIKNLVKREVIENDVLLVLNDEEKKRLEAEVHKYPGIYIKIENKAILIMGNDEGVEKLKKKLIDILQKQEERMNDPDVIRKNDGDEAYLLALFRLETQVPHHWNIGQGKNMSITDVIGAGAGTESVKHPVSSQMSAAIEQLIQNTWKSKVVGTGSDAKGLTHKNIQIQEIQQVENPSLYQQYREMWKRKCFEVGKNRIQRCDIKTLDTYFQQEVHTVSHGNKDLESIRNELINEFFLFHGAPTDVKENICNQGIDNRIFQDGLFGKGSYFAESSTKADQYSDRKGPTRHGGDHYMFLCRVLMLDPFLSAKNRKFNRAPCSGGCENDKCNQGHNYHDSVLGVSGGAGPKLLFREFVVYDKAQSYPEFLIRYHRV